MTRIWPAVAVYVGVSAIAILSAVMAARLAVPSPSTPDLPIIAPHSPIKFGPGMPSERIP